MQAKLELKTFKNILNRISSIPKRTDDLPFAKLVEITCKDNKISMTVTNGDESARVQVETVTTAEGSAVVNYFWLMSIAKSIKSSIDLSIDTNMFKIISGPSEYTTEIVKDKLPLPSLSLKEYPITVPGKTLVQDFEMVRICKSKDENVFTNINMVGIGKNILIGSTDSNRVAIGKPIWNIKENNINVSIKNQTIDALKKIVSDSVADVSVGVTSTYIYFNGPDFVFASKVSSETYPNIYRLIPKTDEFNKATVKGTELLESLKRINAISGSNTKITFGDTVKLQPFEGGGTEVIKCKEANNDDFIIVNSKWLEEIVKPMKDGDITLRFGENNIAGINMLVVSNCKPIRYYIGEMIET